MSHLSQIALCTADLPRTIRTFVEILGFASAGGRPRWGEDAARLQELPSADETSLMMWWLVGRHHFFQIELFHHTVPRQRPRRPDWKPSDLGWTRLGVIVADFDRTLNRLGRAGIPTMTRPITIGNTRRVCFREPGADVVIEILSDDVPASNDGCGFGGSASAVAYVAASVSDLEAARRYFGEAFGVYQLHPESLHPPELEALWGLEEARRQCVVYHAGDVLLELVQYESPTPRAPAPDARLSDQGLMNVAIGYRDRAEMVRALAAARALGASATTGVPAVSGSTYLRIADRLSVELLLVPFELGEAYGFRPTELGERCPSAAS